MTQPAQMSRTTVTPPFYQIFANFAEPSIKKVVRCRVAVGQRMLVALTSPVSHDCLAASFKFQQSLPKCWENVKKIAGSLPIARYAKKNLIHCENNLFFGSHVHTVHGLFLLSLVLCTTTFRIWSFECGEMIFMEWPIKWIAQHIWKGKRHWNSGLSMLPNKCILLQDRYIVFFPNSSSHEDDNSRNKKQLHRWINNTANFKFSQHTVDSEFTLNTIDRCITLNLHLANHPINRTCTACHKEIFFQVFFNEKFSPFW